MPERSPRPGNRSSQVFIGRLELQLDLSKDWEMSCELRKWSTCQSAEVQQITKCGPEPLFEAKEQSFSFLEMTFFGLPGAYVQDLLSPSRYVYSLKQRVLEMRATKEG